MCTCLEKVLTGPQKNKAQRIAHGISSHAITSLFRVCDPAFKEQMEFAKINLLYDNLASIYDIQSLLQGADALALEIVIMMMG